MVDSKENYRFDLGVKELMNGMNFWHYSTCNPYFDGGNVSARGSGGGSALAFATSVLARFPVSIGKLTPLCLEPSPTAPWFRRQSFWLISNYPEILRSHHD